MDRDDDERQARIDLLITQVRAKFERTQQAARRVRHEAQKALDHARAAGQRLRPSQRRKKAG
jgi:hypothetical protein